MTLIRIHKRDALTRLQAAKLLNKTHMSSDEFWKWLRSRGVKVYGGNGRHRRVMRSALIEVDLVPTNRTNRSKRVKS